MIRTTRCTTALIGCALFVALAAPSPAGADPRAAGNWSAHAGGGFILSPEGGLLATGLEYTVVPGLRLGPLMQFAGDDDVFVYAPTLNARYGFDLSQSDSSLRPLEPYMQFGFGLAYVDKDRPGPNRDGTEFLMNGGIGLDYWFAKQVAVGSGMLFNGMPAGKAAGEDFFFSWQLLTIRGVF